MHNHMASDAFVVHTETYSTFGIPGIKIEIYNSPAAVNWLDGE